MKYRTRIYYTEKQKALMWDRWQAGDSIRDIVPYNVTVSWLIRYIENNVDFKIFCDNIAMVMSQLRTQLGNWQRFVDRYI